MTIIWAITGLKLEITEKINILISSFYHWTPPRWLNCILTCIHCNVVHGIKLTKLLQRFKILIHFSTSLVVLEFKTNQGMYCEFTLNLAGCPCIMNPGLQFLVKGLIKSGPSAWHVPDQIERQTGLWKTINKQKWLSFFFHSIKLLNMIWYNFWIMSWVS